MKFEIDNFIVSTELIIHYKGTKRKEEYRIWIMRKENSKYLSLTVSEFDISFAEEEIIDGKVLSDLGSPHSILYKELEYMPLYKVALEKAKIKLEKLLLLK